MEDTGHTSLDAAWDNLQVAMEIWEGELWRSKKKTAGWAICHLTHARRLLERGKEKLHIPGA